MLGRRITISVEPMYSRSQVERIVTFPRYVNERLDYLRKSECEPNLSKENLSLLVCSCESCIENAKKCGFTDFSWGHSAVSRLESELKKYKEKLSSLA